MLITVSRAEALVHARYVFRGLASHAWESAPESRDYLADLVRAWDQRLSELVGTSEELTADEARVLDRLTTAATHPDLSPDAVVEWADAFPAAVADLFGEAGSSGSVTDVALEIRAARGAGNRQPALALAA